MLAKMFIILKTSLIYRGTRWLKNRVVSQGREKERKEGKGPHNRENKFVSSLFIQDDLNTMLSIYISLSLTQRKQRKLTNK